MAAYLGWGANVALFTLACFLAADTANAILGSALIPAPTEAVVASAPPAAQNRPSSARQAIIDRNLFKSAVTAAVAIFDEPEDLEKTRLPLTLLGTAASADPSLAWAAIEDRDKRETIVVGVGQLIKGNATVQRIERRRVVLLENGSPRELTLDDETIGTARTAARTPRGRTQARATPRNGRGAAQVRRLAKARYEVPKKDAEELIRNPTNLFSQARILPKYEDGQMQGVQLNAIKEGSLFEEVGLTNGDVIRELNGISIDSPEESARLLQEFSQANEFVAEVQGADGQTRTITFEMPDE